VFVAFFGNFDWDHVNRQLARGRCRAQRVNEYAHVRAPVNGAPRASNPERPRDGLALARAAAADCRRCELWRGTTQTVFGGGPVPASLMLVGEQPGDHEDREGRPFVGPAGALLDRALHDAGISRREVFLTNAVKHFKYRSRGKRRIHQRPTAEEARACRPWITAELEAAAPRVLVALGATAARSLYGPSVRVTRDRGRPLDCGLAPATFVTIHPSAILRGPTEARAAEYEALVVDLEAAALAAREGGPRRRR
jgi:DNA polymerase